MIDRLELAEALGLPHDTRGLGKMLVPSDAELLDAVRKLRARVDELRFALDAIQRDANIALEERRAVDARIAAVMDERFETCARIRKILGVPVGESIVDRVRDLAQGVDE